MSICGIWSFFPPGHPPAAWLGMMLKALTSLASTSPLSPLLLLPPLPSSELFNPVPGEDFYSNLSLCKLLMLCRFHRDTDGHCQNAEHPEPAAHGRDHAMGRARARLALGRISSLCYLLAVSWYVFEFIYFSSLKTTFS